MKVKLLKADNFDLIDHAASECYDTKPKSNEAERFIRVHRICNVYKHDSLLEFGSATWEIEASAKTLLQITRHRHGSYACKSTRYTIDKSEIIFESTGQEELDKLLNDWKKSIEEMIPKYTRDEVSMLLPMAYQYRFQVQFNYRSLKNFFELRRSRHAQNEIREVAELMLDSLPEHIQGLYR